MQAKTKNKLSLLLITLLFIVPILLAFYFLDKEKPSKNHGDLIQPPVKVTDNPTLKQYEKFWTIVYQQSADCDKHCKQMLETIYRIRLTRGHNKDRIKLLAIHAGQKNIEIPANFSVIEQQSYQDGSKLDAVFKKLSAQSLGNNEGLYIIAPEGFLMMSYPHDFVPQDVIKDLSLMLRARKNNG